MWREFTARLLRLDLTALIAVYGAALSTIVALIQWRQHTRRNLKVIPHFGVSGGALQAVRYTIVNAAHRPITISKFGVRLPGPKDPFYFSNDKLPIELTDGQQYQLWSDSSSTSAVAAKLKENYKEKASTLKLKFFCEDALGKRYYSDGFNLPI